MEALVTRREFREELAVTRRELREEIATTRRDLHGEIAATRQELHAEIAATRQELRETRQELRAEIQASEARLEQKLEQKLELKLEQKLDQKLGAFRTEMFAELARHVTAMVEQIRSEIRGIDDQYKDLPGRVTALEQRVLAAPTAPKRARAPKRRTPTR